MILFFLCFVIIIVLISITKLSLEIKVDVKNRENHSSITLRFLGGLIKLRLNYSLSLLGKGIISFLSGKKNLDIERQFSVDDILNYLIEQIRIYKKYGTQIRSFISKVSLDRFYLNLRIGLGNSALTALVYGLIQTFLAGIYSFNIGDIKSGDIEERILPDFHERIIVLNLDCIIHIKLGHIIITGIRIFLQEIKGGDIFERTPHREYNDYHYGKY